MRRIKFLFQFIVAFIIALFAYKNLYEPHAESVRAEVQNVFPATWNDEKIADIPQETLRISILDVGEAEAILLQDGSRNIMIDVGDSRIDKMGNGGRAVLAAALQKAGVKKINTVIITHHHADHMGNIMWLRGKFGVKNIYDNGYSNDKNPVSVRLNQDFNAGYYHHRVLKAGDKIDFGQGYYLDVLAPGDFIDSKLYNNINNTSLVMKLHYGKFTMLLTGDAEVSVESALQQKYGSFLKADVLKVGHHGSKTSSNWYFINKVKPDYALISCGAPEIYHHPNKNVVGSLRHLGARVLTTVEHGTITVVTDGEKFKVTTEK